MEMKAGARASVHVSGFEFSCARKKKKYLIAKLV
jgi:hypothetical protein